MDGVLVIDKPVGPTSHDCVLIVRKFTKVKKVGHLGTLDPGASGVLPIAMNGATKLSKELSSGRKLYEFSLVLGVETDTDDDMGAILRRAPVPEDAISELNRIIPNFIGDLLQRPPLISAIKRNGLKACEATRAGMLIEIEPRPIRIDSIEFIDSSADVPRLLVGCQAGTYIRALARDLGRAIGTLGHASKIRRLQSGPYLIDSALGLEELRARPEIWRERLIPIKRLSGLSL